MLSNTKKIGFCSYLRTILVNFASIFTTINDNLSFEMKKSITALLLAGLTTFGFCMCSAGSGQEGSGSPTKVQRQVPTFDADSAYNYVAGQLAFGPRVPGTPAQQEAAVWLQNELKRHGAVVSVTNAEATAYDGSHLPIINIVGSYNPEAKNRILLMSHWDSRPISDNDPDRSKYNTPVDGANDGASGVGVLLEIARQAGMLSPKVGIDIFLTDAEDYGAPDEFKGEHKETYWALGTQAWCRNPHVKGYRANFGILLDMVGAKGATFYREYYSTRYAQDIVNRVWGTAASLGFGRYFINEEGAGVTDDHVFVNKMTGIPTIDIIDTRVDGEGTFYPYWHTTGDTLDKIDKETLKVVGTVLLNLLY